MVVEEVEEEVGELEEEEGEEEAGRGRCGADFRAEVGGEVAASGRWERRCWRGFAGWGGAKQAAAGGQRDAVGMQIHSSPAVSIGLGRWRKEGRVQVGGWEL